jgi:hypothetical protein
VKRARKYSLMLGLLVLAGAGVALRARGPARFDYLWQGSRPVSTPAARSAEVVSSAIAAQAAAPAQARSARGEVRRPRGVSPSSPPDRDLHAPSAAEQREREFDEDQGMNAFDNTPEQAEWRDTYAKERADPRWTHEMEAEVQQRAAGLDSKVRLRNLECHETVCRMYLLFADGAAARSYMAAPHPASIRYEYQSLDPEFGSRAADPKNFTFEVLVHRAGDAPARASADTPPAHDTLTVQTASE